MRLILQPSACHGAGLRYFSVGSHYRRSKTPKLLALFKVSSVLGEHSREGQSPQARLKTRLHGLGKASNIFFFLRECAILFVDLFKNLI